MLLELATSYWKLGQEWGEAVALDYLVPPAGARSMVTRLVRETPKKLNECFLAPPEKAIGLIMHLRGDLFYPQFAAEAGLHTVREKQKERVCLIEAALPPFANYAPTRGIERPGAINEKGAASCRLYDDDKHVLRDAVLGERPWRGESLLRCLANLVEDRLNRMIERMTS
jgi:hypothetical protein